MSNCYCLPARGGGSPHPVGQKPKLAEQQRWLARELGDEALFPNEHSGKESLRNLLSGRKAAS
jgi:hypothetical protein